MAKQIGYLPTTIKLDGDKFVGHQMEEAAKSKEAWGDLQLLSAQIIGLAEFAPTNVGIIMVYHSPTLNRNFCLALDFSMKYLNEIGALVYPEGY